MSRCIVCGSSELFFDHHCKQCYLKNYPILKQKKDLGVFACSICELIFLKSRLTTHYIADIGKNSVNTFFLSLLRQSWDFHYRPKNLHIKEIAIDPNENGYSSMISGIVDISASPDAFVPLLTISEEFRIHIEWQECLECRNRLTGSYNSKIQIRTPKKVEIKQLEKWAEEIESLSQMHPLADGKNPLFKVDFLKSGIDALFQTYPPATSVGKIFAKKYGGIISVTTEFAGFDKSRSREYPRKPVVLITLPEFNSGDIITINNHNPIQIRSFKESKVEFWDYRDKVWKKIPLKSFLASDPKFLDREFQQFQLVNFEQDRKMAQIMNMDTFDTHYIDSKEVSDVSEGETFQGILFDGMLLRKQEKA
ncbi:MAG: hypothetical protein JSV04_08030 [Candidatus Heimdallarchaeota archaeon]|nr:MAG: hypothetical protein JSV04_08030 [Candidatus Heimdallarchaeota archaeon]